MEFKLGNRPVLVCQLDYHKHLPSACVWQFSKEEETQGTDTNVT